MPQTTQKSGTTRPTSAADERDALAIELAELYPSFVQKIADLFSRIDENTGAISDLHGEAPRGEWRRLVDAELVSRNLDRYTAEQPPLRDNLKLPRFDRPTDIAYPVPPSLNPYATVMLDHIARSRPNLLACMALTGTRRRSLRTNNSAP